MWVLLIEIEVTAVVQMGKSIRRNIQVPQSLVIFYLGVVGSLVYCVWLGDAALCTYKSRNQEVIERPRASLLFCGSVS